MSVLEPPDDDIVADERSLLRVLRAGRAVRQGALRRIVCHDEQNGFLTWLAGPRLAVGVQPLTYLRVLAHDAAMPATVVSRLVPPRPSAVLLLAVEVDGVPITVEVPNTRTAANVPLPVTVPLALGGPLVGTGRWYADRREFHDHQRSGGGETTVRAERSLVDLRLFEAGTGAQVSGVVEHAELVSSALYEDVTTIVVRTIVDIPMVVWCAPLAGPPPPGVVFDGLVATSGFSPALV